MPAWTQPPTFSADPSELALWNTYLRDNMGNLKAPQTASYTYAYSASAYESASPSSFAAISANMTLNLTTYGGDVLLEFNARLTGTPYLDFAIDGVREGASDGILAVPSGGASGTAVRMFWLKQELLAGAHTFSVQWKASGGSSLLSVTPPQFVVREFS